MGNLVKNSGVALLAFAEPYKDGGKIAVTPFTNKETGDSFKSLVFTDKNGQSTMVNFSSNLGELTAAEIAARKAELQVVSMDSGTFILCKQGELPAGEAVNMWG